MPRLYLVTLLALAACNLAPEDAVPYTPPASYRVLWDSAQACTGRSGDYDELRFFTTPGHAIDGSYAAKTFGTTIYIAEDWVASDLVVKHEMIHALGVSGHPYHPFDDPCRAMWADIGVD